MVLVHWSSQFQLNQTETTASQKRKIRYVIRLRFRQDIGYPWLFYEVWPIAAWAEERDYEFTPGIRFRRAVVLGDPPKTTRLGD